MSSWLLDQRTWIIIISLLSLFFVGLTLYYSLQKRTRRFAPATFVITLGCLSSLIRSIFVPYFSRAGGVWRLFTVLLVIIGGVMYQRQWNQMKRDGQRASRES
jgi:uncharacterized membrane protein